MKVQPIPSRARKLWVVPQLPDNVNNVDFLVARRRADLGQFSPFAKPITLIPVRKCK